jgi:hypothetical protein
MIYSQPCVLFFILFYFCNKRNVGTVPAAFEISSRLTFSVFCTHNFSSDLPQNTIYVHYYLENHTKRKHVMRQNAELL